MAGPDHRACHFRLRNHAARLDAPRHLERFHFMLMHIQDLQGSSNIHWA
jgi:hypothetical protein